jgi:hypothetical protein
MDIDGQPSGLDDLFTGLAPDGVADAGADGVIGDVTDADFWFEQGTGFTCGPSSATQIIEDFTGADLPDETVVAEVAAERGWLTADGIAPDDLAALLTEFGVPSTVERGQDWDDLAGYLAEGRAVVMMVDAYDYWAGQDQLDQPENSDEDVANHVIRIVGIDTVRGVAIVSDSGTDDGRRLEISLEALEEAWNDVTAVDQEGDALRERILIVSDAADPTDAPAAGAAPGPLDEIAHLTGEAPSGDAPSGLDGIFRNPHGFVIVPVVLAAARIMAAARR